MQLNRVKVIAWLKMKDMSQTELARVTGVSRGTISNICRGCSCSKKTADQLAAALNVSVDDLK